MPFVHGHARDAGWVVSHFRRPQRAGSEQLGLDEPEPASDSLPELLPGPRASTEDDHVTGEAGPR